MTAADAGLGVHGLSVAYDVRGAALPAVTDVSFTVAPGETYALVGESGCGKSTVAYALARYLPRNGHVTGGDVRLDGTDVLALRGERLRRWRADALGMVYQEPGAALNPTMRVGDQVAELYALQGLGRGEARRLAHDRLAEVALPDPVALARRYPHQLSGGQQQRVVIAMALATRPRLLVLDEPTTGLDATVEAEVLDLVAALRAELDAAILFISHNLALVGRMCDRVGVLYAGRVVEEGPVREVLRDPQHPYTSGLLRCVPRMGVTKDTRPLEPIPGAPPSPGELAGACTFTPRCPVADAACLVEPPLAEVADGRRARCVRPGADPVVHTPVPPPTVRPTPRPGLLVVEGVTKRYGEAVAVDDVHLEVGDGEVVGLVGESGSGKTTLGRCIVGLTAPDAGRITFEGQPLARVVEQRPRQVRQRLQMVFQSPDGTLNPRHRVGRILRRAVRALGGRRSAEELAASVHLPVGLLAMVAARLSGGQKQRVAIARAFAGRPALVVCDEPVSALDVSVQAAVLTTLARLQEDEGVSYLFISHDLAVVRYLADRIAVMYRGQIVEQGPADEVFSAPRHPYTRTLLAAVPALDAEAVAPLPTARVAGPGTGGGADPGGGCRFLARCPDAVTGLCEADPPSRRLAGGHEVRCHLAW